MKINKRTLFRFIFIVTLSLGLLAACGGKSQESVTKKLQKNLEDISSYQMKAEMTMKTGREDRTYDIDVLFKKGDIDYYRVDLQTKTGDNKQIILKNKEGVFVITPVLNKSFKFQADWPEESGQPYLYQSLIHDIVTDQAATFAVTDAGYVFKTKTNYLHNKNLPFQEIHLDKKTLQPKRVHVMDKDEQVLVEVVFHQMIVNPTLSDNDFNREAILAKEQQTDAQETVSQQSFEVLFPLNTKGAELAEKKEIALENGTRIIMTFKGDRNFTFIQEKKEVTPATTTPEFTETMGDLVHLGHSVGVVTDQAIEWNYQGVDYYLASEEMTIDELIEVASSVSGQEVK